MATGVRLNFNQERGQRFRTNVSEDGKQRLCTGPAHDIPTWLPNTEKYFYLRNKATGMLSSRCRLCMNWSRLKTPGSTTGYVDVVKVRPFFIEAVNRVGMVEVARRAGVTTETVRRVYTGSGDRIQKAKVRAVLLELISMRRKGEVRHRDSISYGATVRKPYTQKAHRRKHRSGKMLEIPAKVKTVGKEKKVVETRDLYHPHGDIDNEKRSLRRERTRS